MLIGEIIAFYAANYYGLYAVFIVLIITTFPLMYISYNAKGWAGIED